MTTTTTTTKVSLRRTMQVDFCLIFIVASIQEIHLLIFILKVFKFFEKKVI